MKESGAFWPVMGVIFALFFYMGHYNGERTRMIHDIRLVAQVGDTRAVELLSKDLP